MENSNILLGSKRNFIIKFIRNYFFLIAAIVICLFLAFYNLGDIEFWGEDEAQTLLYSSRFIMGLENYSLSNLTAFYENATFSLVILVQIPFILLFGVTELAARVPSALITVLTIFVLYKIGKLFLSKKTINFLLILFSVSGAIGLFKTAFGVGFYIFFILLGFYKIEKFLYAKNRGQKGIFRDLQLGLIFITISLMFVPDAYFYIPFFIVLILVNIKKIGVKRLLISLTVPIVLFLVFIYCEFILPLQLTGEHNATYDHLLGRGEGFSLSFNIKELILDYVTNYSIYLVVLFFIALITILIFKIKKVISIPIILRHLILLFALHIIFWMFFVENECGHLMNSYPIVLFTIAFAYNSITNFICSKKSNIDNKKTTRINDAKVSIRGIALVVVNTVLVLLICFNFYHTFILFNNLSLDKSKYFGFYIPGSIPCGYASGHKVGIKSAAYLLRKERKNINELLVSDKGGAFNFIYMGGNFAGPYNAYNSIELIVSGEDLYNEHGVRFIGISPDFPNKEYLDIVESKGFNKIIIKYGDKELYTIYDILNKDSKIITIDRDQYDKQYISEYSNVEDAIPYFKNF